MIVGRAAFTKIPENVLENISTKRLLAYYKKLSNKFLKRNYYDEYSPEEYKERYGELDSYLEIIKSLLNKREHVT